METVAKIRAINELLEYFFVCEQPRAGGTDLARIGKHALRNAMDGSIDVRVGEDNDRRLSAQFQGKAFYVPRSHPDGYSVNVRCLDPSTIVRLDVEPFDDNNREAETARLRHLSQEQ